MRPRVLWGLLLLAACAQPAVPRRLAQLPRTKLVTGARAVALLAQLHGGKVRVPWAAVAEYGRGRLALYLARYPSREEAHQALQRMVAGIAHSGQFSEPRWQSRETQRYLTVGPGGHHLFWRAETSIYWLAGVPEAVLAAAKELPPPPSGLLI